LTLRLDSPVNNVKGVGAKYLHIFEKNGISTVFDLLLHFPVLYIDFSKVAAKVEMGIKKLYLIEILNFSLSHNYRRRLSILKVNARVGMDRVQVVFFNKHYLNDFFKKNKNVYIYGTFEIRNNTCQANTPIVFMDPHIEPVIPLYNKISTIKSGTLKKIIKNCFDELQDKGTFEFLPSWILEHYGFPGIVEAFKHIHFPQSDMSQQVQQQKQRFIYSEFLFFQLELQYIRNFFKKVPRFNQYEIDREWRQTIRKNLPFELTADQWTTCEEMAADLKQDVTMQRLLQGDVGTGKTIVVFIALFMAVQSGFQGAFLVPTEILAQQHFINGKKFFKSTNIEILTGSTSAKEKKRIRQQLQEGSINIIFGTHALLDEKIQFKNLSMVVIDEQHRFGVSQRAALYYKGKSVDLLVTTATPIPRTMLLSLYNDLSVSVIKTKPLGRLPIITKIIDSARRHEFYLWLRKKIQDGEKAYIILPLIEDSEFFTELRSIESETEYFKNILKGLSIGIVSGRMSQDEKDTALSNFAAGRTKVLISTTVIEVGIDVRDATFIVIENADRYGLSQLHQLRGRVGRGELQSYCYLFASPNITEKGKRRLKTIASTTDGFKIAETDLKMRGGGIISGFEQSGYLDFKVGNMQDDHEIFINAQRDAALILEDPSLQNDYISNFLNEIKKKLKEITFS
jgi:ATP-dependent DNA helicase RecG